MLSFLGKKSTLEKDFSEFYSYDDNLSDSEREKRQKELYEELYKEKHRGEWDWKRLKQKDENTLLDEAKNKYDEPKSSLDEKMRMLLKGANGDLIKDAAALCQLTYACDPNRSGDNIYRTASRNWIPYIPKNENYLSKRTLFLFKNSFDDQLRPLNMQKYSLLEKIGFGTFKAIFTDDDIFDEFDRRISRVRTGFFSMLYFRRVNNETHLAYVTAGTTFNTHHKYDILMDNIITNGGQAILGLSPQYTLAIQNAKILNKICEENNYKLFFFGHSLGGGMAIANALATNKTKRKAIVFNNAGLNYFRNFIHGTYWSKEASWWKISDRNILRIYTEKDFLSTEKYNRLFISKPFMFLLSPQNVGEKIFFGEGGHGIDDICKAMDLEFLCNKNQIIGGI